MPVDLSVLNKWFKVSYRVGLLFPHLKIFMNGCGGGGAGFFRWGKSLGEKGCDRSREGGISEVEGVIYS